GAAPVQSHLREACVKTVAALRVIMRSDYSSGGDTTMAKKLLFIGAGAIGSYLGSFLSRAGHDVTIVDPWAEQVDTINAQGIKVTGPHDPFTARPRAVHLNEAA